MVLNRESCFEILCNALNNILKLFSLPARHGGLGIRDPLSTAVSSFANSRKCIAHIVDAIKSNSVLSVFNHIDYLLKLHWELNQEVEIQYQNLLKSVLPTFDDTRK